MYMYYWYINSSPIAHLHPHHLQSKVTESQVSNLKHCHGRTYSGLSKVRPDELKILNTPDIDLPRLFQTNSDVMYRFDSPEVGVAVWPVACGLCVCGN